MSVDTRRVCRELRHAALDLGIDADRLLVSVRHSVGEVSIKLRGEAPDNHRWYLCEYIRDSLPADWRVRCEVEPEGGARERGGG